MGFDVNGSNWGLMGGSPYEARSEKKTPLFEVEIPESVSKQDMPHEFSCKGCGYHVCSCETGTMTGRFQCKEPNESNTSDLRAKILKNRANDVVAVNYIEFDYADFEKRVSEAVIATHRTDMPIVTAVQGSDSYREARDARLAKVIGVEKGPEDKAILITSLAQFNQVFGHTFKH